MYEFTYISIMHHIHSDREFNLILAGTLWGKSASHFIAEKTESKGEPVRLLIAHFNWMTTRCTLF